MATTFHLLVAIPDKEPVSYDVSGEKVTLGRAPDNDIQILVREVSTAHAEFYLTESGYEITDVGSTNGTKVNEVSVKNGRIALNDRDALLLGETIPAYFVGTEEGESIDVKAVIAEIEETKKAEKPKLSPPVKKIGLPAAAKKAGIPSVKPPVSKPLSPVSPTPAAESESGSATVKLTQKKVGAPQLGSPAAKKLAPPASKKLAPPASKKLAPPAKKLAAPAATEGDDASAAAAPAKKLAPPAKKLAAPGAGAAPAKKLAPPAGAAPARKLAAPGAAGAPAKKLTLPAKKAAPKLNMPKKDGE